MEGLEQYRFQIPVEVRFADLDALGHLNNAKYLTYAEQARIRYVHEVCGWGGDWARLGMILARTEIDHKLPIAFGDRVQVYVRVGRLGDKSFDMHYVITQQRGEGAVEIAAEIKTIMVTYDYEQDATVQISDQWREAITDFEPAL